MGTWQTYDPKSGKQTTYSGSTKATKGAVSNVSYSKPTSSGRISSGAGTSLPSKSGLPSFINAMGQTVHGDDPNYQIYKNQLTQSEGADAYNRNTSIAAQTAKDYPNLNPSSVESVPNIPTTPIIDSQSTETQVFDKEMITNNIASAYQNAVKSGSNIANKAFVDGVARVMRGRNATPDELGLTDRTDLKAVGLSLDDVLERFGATDIITSRLPDMGLNNGSAIPGSNKTPGSQIEADREFANEDGTINLPSYSAWLLDEVDRINEEYIDTQNELIDYQADTQGATQNIGQQLGTTVGLLQGEQRAMQQQRALGENTLTRKLGIKEQEKANLIERGNLQMVIDQKLYDRKRDVINDARNLRKDQQDAFAIGLEIMFNSGMDPDNLSKEQIALINKNANSFGLTSDTIIDGLDVMHADRLYERMQDSLKDDEKPKTDTQLQAQTFGERMQNASKVITKFEDLGKNLWGIVSGADQYPNIMKSEDRQEMEQAQRNFVNAVLRQESGAAIADSEFDSAKKQYFPQPGDKAGVIEQKRVNRQTAINGMLRQAGETSNDEDYSW